MLIHLGWLGSPSPAHVLSAVDAARAAAPDCEVMLHADEAVVPERWRSRLLPVMRSDVLRHAVLRRYGGLWLDADVRLLASPTAWAATWDRYTAIRYGGMVGTDILYVPAGWDGWPVVEAYLNRFFAEPPTRVRLDALAAGMVEACRQERPEAFQVVDCRDTFPTRPGELTTESVVARGFDPSGVTAKPPRPPAPGLGDMVTAGLSAVGITKERVSSVLGRPCGCGKRAAALNRLGAAIGLPPGSTASN